MTELVRRLSLVVGLVVGLAFNAACSGQKTVTYNPDYPSYDSLSALYTKADLVVEAKIEPGSRVLVLLPGAGSGDEKANPGGNIPADRGAMVSTAYHATVLRAYKGAANAGQTIEVKQLGGQKDGTTYVEAGAEQLKPNQTYILFLATFPDSPASMLNPWQGQYPVDANGEPVTLQENSVRITRAELEKLARAK